MDINVKNFGNISVEEHLPAIAIAKQLDRDLAKKICAVAINGVTKDLISLVMPGDQLEFFTFDQEEGAHTFHHSSSHIMAQAIQHLYPDTKFGIGPAIKDGFYYDLDSPHVFTTEDLAAIEKEMQRIVKENLPYTREELTRTQALALFRDKGEQYKVELINDLPEDTTISIYRQGDYVDLCAGPHLLSTGQVKAFKLMSLAGAYWRGSEKNKMLQRIYAVSFPTKEQLAEHLFKLEEAKKRDHRKLGAELELFLLLDEGPGFPFFLPKGMILRNQLESYWREMHEEWGYQEIKTPMILNQALWERSGHWEHYQNNMYFTQIDNENFAIKPMNCPCHIQIFKQGLKSYRDLPIRLAEFGSCHRNEPSGT
ncbi:MAG: aminoacyl--tRNA ligase-related protein, partial [Clostridiales bacterium]